MSSPALADLLQRADLWRGDALAHAGQAGVPTGFAALDAALPGGGWPCGALSELLLQQQGVGELSLLMPALAGLEDEAGAVALVAPPLKPNAPAWRQAGIPLERLLVVEADAADAPWACEQLLASHGVAALLAWLPEVDARSLRRLQLAAEAQSGLAFIMRPDRFASTASPAPLRLRLEAGQGALDLHVLKRRGPPLTEPLQLSVARPVEWNRVRRIERIAPVLPFARARSLARAQIA
jgi:hypothetical protein